MALHPESDIMLKPLVPASDESAFKRTLRPTPVWESWRWELAALSLAILTLVGLIILFGYVSAAQPTSGLLAAGITVGAIVSVLGNVFAACLGFVVASCMAQLKWLHYKSKPRPLIHLHNLDKASHGIFGALRLLFWHPVAGPIIILTASLLCVKGLVGPFFQQVVHQGVQATNLTNSEYTLPVGRKINNTQSEYTPGDFSNINDPLRSAILQGIFRSHVEPFNTTTPVVPTYAGNATWGPSWTLNVCSECRDVSDRIDAKQFQNTTKDFGLWSTAYYWNLTLPNGHVLHKAPGSEVNDGGIGSAWKGFYIFNVSAHNPSIAFGGRRDALTDFTAISMPSNASEVTEARALECIIALCARQLSASWVDGTFAEEYVGPAISFNYSESNDASKGVSFWDKARGVTNKAGVTYSTEMNVTDGNRRNVTLSCFAGGGRMLADLLSLNVFNGTMRVVSYTMDEYGAYGPAIVVGDVGEVLDTVHKTAISNPPNLTLPDLVGNIVRSVNLHLRTRAGGSAQVPASGTWRMAPFVAVRWPWIAFPAAVLALIGFVFAVTWVQTSKAGAGAWKDNILATMFYGLNDDLRNMPRDAVTLDELEDLAGRVHCQTALWYTLDHAGRVHGGGNE